MVPHSAYRTNKEKKKTEKRNVGKEQAKCPKVRYERRCRDGEGGWGWNNDIKSGFLLIIKRCEKMSLRQWVKLQHRIADEKACAFIDGICFAVMVYCFIYTYFFLI